MVIVLWHYLLNKMKLFICDLLPYSIKERSIFLVIIEIVNFNKLLELLWFYAITTSLFLCSDLCVCFCGCYNYLCATKNKEHRLNKNAHIHFKRKAINQMLGGTRLNMIKMIIWGFDRSKPTASVLSNKEHTPWGTFLLKPLSSEPVKVQLMKENW